MGERAENLSAIDLWPIAKKLPRHEQVQLAKLLLSGAATAGNDAAAYLAEPPGPDEFASDVDPLGWDGEGWEEFYA